MLWEHTSDNSAQSSIRLLIKVNSELELEWQIRAYLEEKEGNPKLKQESRHERTCNI